MEVPVSDPITVNDAVSKIECGECDKEVVHRIAQLLLPGLATACIDYTSGDLFRSPGSVAVDIRKEMVEYLRKRSESFVAESVLQRDGDAGTAEEISDDPIEIVSVFVDEFGISKRNLFSRVSGWVMSESREDKIDDLVQEMEMNVFWPIDRREMLAAVILRNIDYKKAFHCSDKFESPEEFAEHKMTCRFRTVSCRNEGCKVKFSALHAAEHDEVCPYKILPCEQQCSQSIMRREMDRHCITVCPMRLVNCPFYQVGCESAFPQSSLQKHCVEFLNTHLLCVLKVINKQEATVEEMKQRIQLLEKSESLNQLSEALDVRSLTLAVKEQEAKIRKLEQKLSKLSLQK